MHTLNDVFRQVNGQILKAGAKMNSSALVSMAFGHATTGMNTTALRIAAERKNYKAVAAMLDISCESTLPSPISFMLGTDWDRIELLAKGDPRLTELMAEYERRSDASIDEMLDGMDMGGGILAMPKPGQLQ